MEHEVKYVTMMGSAAHNYGNVLAIIQKWFLNIFPKDTFKTIHIQSKLAHRQLLSTPHQFLKKTRPVVIFNPRINYDDDRFLAGTLLTERHTELYNRGAYGDLQPFFRDDKNRVAIKYQLNRYAMNIDIITVWNTEMQQINWAHYLRNSLRIKIPFDINCCLESFLSKDMMDFLSHLVGIPLNDPLEGTKPFLDYMNGNSVYPVTYKLQGSTGTDEYYRYYPAKIIATIENMDVETPNKTGHVVTSAQISMSLKLEWFGTGFYYLFSDEIHKVPKPTIPNDSNLIPVYTDVLLEEDVNLSPGWKLYNRATCALNQINDKIDYSSLLNNSIREVIKHHLVNGYPLAEVIDIRVRRQGELLTPGTDFKVDFDNNLIYFNNKNTYFTYTILVSVNVLYINNMIKEILNLK